MEIRFEFGGVTYKVSVSDQGICRFTMWDGSGQGALEGRLEEGEINDLISALEFTRRNLSNINMSRIRPEPDMQEAEQSPVRGGNLGLGPSRAW
jgi:hypothetical protein